MQTNPGRLNEGLVPRLHQPEVFLPQRFWVYSVTHIYSSDSNYLPGELKMSRNHPNASYLHSRAKSWHWVFPKTTTFPYLCQLALLTIWINNSQWRRTEGNLLLWSLGLNVAVQCPPPANHSPRFLPQEGSDSQPLPNLTFTKLPMVFFSKSYWKVI